MIRELVSRNNITFMCLQETKCSTWSKEAVNSLWNHSDNEWVEGTENWLECEIRSLMDGGSFYVFNIYSPQHLHQKRKLWDQLANRVALLGHESLCFVGDFNSIRDAYERENCDYRRIDMQFFNQFIENNNLLNIEISDSQFTWFGPAGKKSKLDRVLMNNVWWGSGKWSLATLDKKISYHKALLLRQKVQNWGSVPFKVYNCWLKDEVLLFPDNESRL
ncbi:hypothetical protein POM88_054951 [Heracleum sosnowskyi]|uniref:Endonuclease/exonuclease/phosphatase domain-containing protein n=1 Tax=Heracleum sosnowskyi TaxID=360622 RepID=A0AAD8GLG5_9APIA|nr:hypothetical protein POM88_054951 [Heracleum sosnowskyi]